MITLNQLARKKRLRVKRKKMVDFLKKSPQKKGICVRVYTTKPKKPHSGIRKIAKVFIPSLKINRIVAIPGQTHNLSAHSVVLIRGGRVRDIPGVHSKIYRNQYDFVKNEPFERRRRRSKYGYKRIKL
jgi:small subunit ribosomal protein S12